MKFFGCHGNELQIKEILYQSVFGDKYYMIGHKFTIYVTMDVSPFAWCLAVLNVQKSTQIMKGGLDGGSGIHYSLKN